ncbi:MAG: hypothetical protein A2W99_01835 [Bacteroidetes bacterium GWF2_33_16]|nr:MAG: hypothetical protein A2X00_16320 [Bacteroidetes bacterium GWE2_32_14]OFY07010.1 MAG: hypothetical protein A2W99_01835 [Bacteroidetes bacterium GWF2_33_16]
MSSLDSELYWKIIKLLRFVKRNFFIIISVFAIFFISVKYVFPLFKGKSIEHVRVEVLTNNELKALKKYPNAFHLQVAQSKGITSPIKSRQEFEKNPGEYIGKFDLKKLKDTKYYDVPFLSHSLPYLKDDAYDFLNILGLRFHNRLNELGLRKYRFSISSVLRTTNDQKGLRKSNVNATPNNSSHYYGLTFDLAQTQFYESGKKEPVYSYRLRNLLLVELIKLQEQGKCYVLLENQTKCIHITVR